MKENTKMIKNPAMEFSNGLHQETNIGAIILMILGTVTVKCIGQMVPIIKDLGIREYKMV